MKQLLRYIDDCLVPMDFNIIVVTGRTASGKDTVADYMVNTYGYTKISISSLLKLKTKDHSKEGLLAFQEEIRKDDQAAVGKLLVKELYRLKKKHIVISGIRTFLEWKTVLTSFPYVGLVFIHTNTINRYKRIRNRNRPGDPIVFDDFLRVDLKEENIFDFDMLEAESNLTLINE